jgi:phosphoadenosine phosphosulfate reductase
VYAHHPDRCCHDRKIVPLRRAIVGYDAWISAIRADQSADRSRARVVGWDGKFGLMKINPLLRWSRRDVWAYIVTHDVPYNPLHDQGYPSIGCWPCTRAVSKDEADEDERAGRWAGQAKTECGLHSLDSSQL